MRKSIAIGITGASGAIYGIRLIELLKSLEEPPIIHLVISEFGKETIRVETDWEVEQVEAMADYVHSNNYLGASIASGSFLIDATVILPCTMKTLAAVACGYSDTLIARACDVALKEKRQLIICPRESPVSAIHLENMLKLSKLGVDIMPLMPAYYNNPQSIEEIVDHQVMKIMDHLKLEHRVGKRWQVIE